MSTNFDIEIIKDKIQEKVTSKIIKNEKLGVLYIVSNIEEDVLLEVGFKFISYDSKNNYPIYKMGDNIEAYFKEQDLYMYEITH